MVEIPLRSEPTYQSGLMRGPGQPTSDVQRLQENQISICCSKSCQKNHWEIHILSGDLHEQKHHEDQFFHNPDLYSQTYKKYSYSRRLIIHPTRSRSAISHRIPQLLFSRNHGTSSFLSPETDPVRAYLVVLGVLGEDGGGLLGWMKNPCESPPVRISHCLLLLGNVA